MKKNSSTSPPYWTLKILRRLLDQSYLEEIEGDLEERFEDNRERYGLKKARWFYVLDSFKLLRPALMRKAGRADRLNHYGMFKHNFLLAFRSFKKYKSSFAINLMGLSIGLASVLLIYLWVVDEQSVDKFHDRDDKLYKVMLNIDQNDGVSTAGYTPILLAKTLMEEYPEVQLATAVSNQFPADRINGMLSNDQQFTDAKGLMVDRQFFEVLNFELLQGNREQILSSTSNIVISESLAFKLFGGTNVLGSELEWESSERKKPFQIAGIFKDPSVHSSLQFEFLLPFDVLVEADEQQGEWYSCPASTYVRLQEGTEINAFNEKIKDLLKSKHQWNEGMSIFLTSFADLYLEGNFENGKNVGGRIAYVHLFSAIAFFILLIACINFMNLSTAQASRRLIEIGVKKAYGVNGNALVLQYLSESVLLALFSFLIAVLIVFLLLPEFNSITDKGLRLHFVLKDVLYIATIIIGTGVIAGLYPALYLSRFRTLTALKGRLRSAFGETFIRKGLVIFQLSLSAIFIIGFLVIDGQVNYVGDKHMGYDRDQIVIFKRGGSQIGSSEAFLSTIKDTPGVVNAFNMYGDLLTNINMNRGYTWQGSDEGSAKLILPSPPVNDGFVETLGLKLVAGRSFSGEYGDESSKLVINQTAAKNLGLSDPVGQWVKRGDQEMQVIGVVEDFHHGSLHESIQPVFFRYEPDGRTFLVKIQADNYSATLRNLESVYQQFHPKQTFDYRFLDEEYHQLYQSEQKIAVLSKYFTGLAIFISCLGLFGLSNFVTERRTKEISIRKVLGASSFNLIRLLLQDFTRMALLSSLVALPVGYLVGQHWLEGFAYRIDLEWWFFVGSGIALLLFTWLTVGFHTLKASQINPVETLKSE
ncbi:MAG: ABC transporter permease [Bacteroidota bacterium]